MMLFSSPSDSSCDLLNHWGWWEIISSEVMSHWACSVLKPEAYFYSFRHNSCWSFQHFSLEFHADIWTHSSSYSHNVKFQLLFIMFLMFSICYSFNTTWLRKKTSPEVKYSHFLFLILLFLQTFRNRLQIQQMKVIRLLFRFFMEHIF